MCGRWRIIWMRHDGSCIGNHVSLTAANSGSESINAADTAGILIFLEQIGFEVESNILVQAVLPGLVNKPCLTGCELDVLRYPSQNGRHYMEIRCQLNGGGGPVSLRESSIRTTHGIRIRAILADEQPYVLHIKGPRHKKPPAALRHHRDYCGMGLHAWRPRG